MDVQERSPLRVDVSLRLFLGIFLVRKMIKTHKKSKTTFLLKLDMIMLEICKLLGKCKLIYGFR